MGHETTEEAIKLYESGGECSDFMTQDDSPDRQRIVSDLMNEDRDRERIELFRKYSGQDIRGKKALEVGSGLGTFISAALTEGAVVDGIEPSAAAVDFARKRLNDRGYKGSMIVGKGEALPFAGDSYDLIFSFQTLEHVEDPARTLEECARVLKPGGYMFHIFPNFGSFWEGHYGIFWIPYIQNYPFLLRSYLALLGKDPEFAKKLNFLTPLSVEKTMRSLGHEMETVCDGFGPWAERMRSLGLRKKFWGETKKIYRAASFASRLGLVEPVIWLGKKIRFHYPLMILAQKK